MPNNTYDVNCNKYKMSVEYDALNNIWKSMNQEQKKTLYDDFKVINDFIKYRYSVSDCITSSEVSFARSHEYLNDLSKEAQTLVRSLIEDGEKNLYHSVMAFIPYNYNVSDANELYELYYERYKKTRPYIAEYKEQVMEVMDLCLRRWQSRYK